MPVCILWSHLMWCHFHWFISQTDQEMCLMQSTHVWIYFLGVNNGTISQKLMSMYMLYAVNVIETFEKFTNIYAETNMHRVQWVIINTTTVNKTFTRHVLKCSNFNNKLQMIMILFYSELYDYYESSFVIKLLQINTWNYTRLDSGWMDGWAMDGQTNGRTDGNFLLELSWLWNQ